jgi:hypothetical protein
LTGTTIFMPPASYLALPLIVVTCAWIGAGFCGAITAAASKNLAAKLA